MYNDVVKFIEACDQEKTKNNQQLYNALIGEEYDEFARSNLSKINSETGKVIKRDDGKVLKPEGWTPPQLEQFTK